MNKLKAYYREYRRYIVYLLDVFCVLFAHAFIYCFTEQRIYPHYSYLAIVVMIYLLCNIVCGCYRHLVRFESFTSYLSYLLSAILAAGCNIALYLIIYHKLPDVLNILLAAIFIAIAMIFYRLIIRDILKKELIDANGKVIEKKKNVLIIGAGVGGRSIISSIKERLTYQYHIVGVIDDNPEKRGMMISNVPVLGNRNDIERICEKNNVDLILIAIHSITPKEKREILEICQRTKAKVRILPSTEEIMEKASTLNNLREVSVDDLLGRDPIKLENENISQHISNKVVLVTGGGGSIGSELCRQIMKYNPKLLVIFDIYENNIYDIQMELVRKYGDGAIRAVVGSVRDVKRLDYVFNLYKPAVVFHAAAHKHVPLMEDAPLEAVKNNILGTYNTANAADKYGVEKFVLISTDKAVNSTNIMGATKRFCEMIIQTKDKTSNTNYCAVRFGNVLGSNGSVVPLFRKQIEAGGPVTVTHKEITRFFMTIPEAVGLILQAFAYADGGEIFVLDMGEPVKIYDLAEKMIRLAGYQPNIDIDIVVTGLRPGEKLYEEILMSEEGLTSTKHGKIFVSKPLNISAQEVEAAVKDLSKLEYDKNTTDRDIKDVVKKYVKTYKDPQEVNKNV